MPSKASNRTSSGIPRRVHFIAAILALSGASFYEQSALAVVAKKPGFPKLGQMLIGSPQPYGEASSQAQMARYDLVIIDVSPSSAGPQMRSTLQAIKAKNPNIIILDYLVLNEVSRTASGQQYLRDKLNAQKWWLYPSGTSGTPVSSVWPGAAMTNYTNAVSTDASGDRYNTWYAKEQYRLVWSKVPELDGTYDDNFFWHQRVSGDWDRNGSSDSGSIPRHREGLMRHVNTIKQLMPGKVVTGNIGDWRNTSSVPEYEGQLHGGTLEGYLCRFEKSFAETLSEYHRRMRETAAPKLVMLNAEKCTAEGYNHYKSFRYGLALVLMGDGYYDFNENYTQFPTQWFDEYDLAGTSNTSWLGTAVQEPQTSPWQKGVYKREFQKGMALVNPAGNGNQTVTVGSGWRRINGNQVPSVNTGALANTVTLEERDGILLKREGAAVPPPPPPPPPPGGDAIFQDGFESGSSSAWTEVDSEGDLNVTAAAALNGTFGLAALIDNTTVMYVRDNSPTNEARYRARFYFDPNAITMVSGDLHNIMVALNAGGAAAVARIEFLRSAGGAYQVRGSVRNDAGVYSNTPFVTISDASHRIEIDWQSATSAGANNGSLRLWIDGISEATPTQTLSGIDNDTLRIEQVQLGPQGVIDAGTRGTYYFDAFVSRRTTFIGP